MEGFYGIELLTVDEAAHMLRVSRMTVYRQIHSGELPSVRFGRSIRIPASAIEAYLPHPPTTPEPEDGD
ncbi:helix-turn-helix domain-containing protein [Arthrobacter sp. H14]|uniref:helix-turn-helix domain-containing protein n=1 Tax=Arthrobacter sp. H14 TaxID=1312959 RepID=UPI00056D6CE2|nr:helix-turn-helix domain-containing protein [Arthrobacter sp. H14]